MLRAIALSLALLLSVGVIVPLMTDQSEAAAKKKNKKRKKIKKYSKAWWRIYRAKQKRKKALQARKRSLKARQAKLAKARSAKPELELTKNDSGELQAKVKVSKRGSKSAKADKTAEVKSAPVQSYSDPVLPTGEMAPIGWSKNGASSSDAQFKVSDNGVEVGSADLKVVSPVMGEDDNSGKNKSVGGVSTVALRRTVIDKMFKEQGWVVNDYQKDVDGKKVYVVVAQSPGAGGTRSRVFYFMEADGRVYSLATSAAESNAEKLARDSEKVLNSLKRTSRPIQAAAAATLR